MQTLTYRLIALLMTPSRSQSIQGRSKQQTKRDYRKFTPCSAMSRSLSCSQYDFQGVINPLYPSVYVPVPTPMVYLVCTFRALGLCICHIW